MSAAIGEAADLAGETEPERAPVCQWSTGCDSAAVWRVTVVCCGASAVACDPHLRENARESVFASSAVCLHCFTVYRAGEPLAVQVVEPL